MRRPRWAWPQALQEPEDEKEDSARRSGEVEVLGRDGAAVSGRRSIGAGVLPGRGVAGIGVLFLAAEASTA